MSKKLFYVEIGDSVEQDGVTYHRYRIMGPMGLVLRGARAGTKAEVKRVAEAMAKRKNETFRPSWWEGQQVKRAA